MADAVEKVCGKPLAHESNQCRELLESILRVRRSL
jgi:hypothetical protein